MTDQSIQTLIEELKAFLNFTWTDASRTAKITGYCLSSMQYLEEVADATIDFNTDYLAKDLLFNRVLYMDAQALADYNHNYNSMLEELRIKYLKETNG